MLCPLLIVTDKLLANFWSNRIDSAFLATLIRIKKRACHIIRSIRSGKKMFALFDMVLTDISVNCIYFLSAHWQKVGTAVTALATFSIFAEIVNVIFHAFLHGF
jgi:hypothetical protein